MGKSTKSLLLMLALAAQSASAQQAQVAPVTLSRLDLAVTLNYRNRTLTGTARLRIRNHDTQSARVVPLQINRLMDFEQVSDAAGKPLHFTQDVVRYSDWPSWQVNQAWIELPHPLAPDDTTSITVNYSGYLTGITETGMQYVRERIDSAFTILRWESGGFPYIGVPSVHNNRAAARPDFEFSAHITVPKYEVVATGGVLHGRSESDTTTTYEFRSVRPVPFLNIGIAPYRLSEDRMRMFYFAQDSVGAAALLGAGQRAMDRMTQWFGPLADHTLKPTVIEIGNGYGSQAALAAGIFQQASGFAGKEGYGELYHELSHLWNAANTEPASSRWNEGLAMFLQGLLSEQLDGWAGRRPAMEEYARRFVQKHQNDTLVTRIALIDYGRRSNTDFSYTVGNFGFEVLYELLGAASFNQVIGGFYQKYHGTGASDQQFIAFAKRQSSLKLDQFFNDWFLTTHWFNRLSSGETLAHMAQSYGRAH